MSWNYRGLMKLKLLNRDIAATELFFKYSVALNIVQSSPDKFHIVLRDE